MFIFDIEIKHGIPPKNPAERRDDLIYCAGWEDYQNMKIACIGVWDYKTDSSRIFGEHEIKDFQKFIDSHDKVVGFNNNRFDNNVLRANGVVIHANKSYDILSEDFTALGSFQKGCRLDDIVKANFPSCAGKTGSGADAPELWQKGFYTKVIDYCLNDVRLTKMILDRILRFGYINDPIYPSEILRLRRP
jgi:hypothetical protein